MMPKTRAKVRAFMSDLHVRIVGAVVVVARKPYGAVALEHRDPAAGLRERDAHGVLHRAPFAREIGDGDAARAALVDAPHAIARLGDRKKRLLHQLPPEGACTWITVGFSIGGRRISCSRLGRSRRW